MGNEKLHQARQRRLICGIRVAAISLIILTVPVQRSYTQAPTSTSYGRDFYIGFMRNVGGSQFVSLRLVVGTNANSANYIVRTSGEMIRQGTVTSGNPVVIEIPSNPRQLNLQVTDSSFSNRDKGINIQATGTEPIFVIAENFVNPFNFGVFLAYPCLTVPGGNYEYYVVSTAATDILSSQFLLVGCEDDTTISITPTQMIEIPQDPQMATTTSTTINANTESHQFSLDQYQTLLVQGSNDLTGTKIVSNKPLTVISGHECANVPISESGCEPLAVHVPPLTFWGSTFLLASFAGRTGEQRFKAISAVETDAVYTCGTDSTLAQSTTTIEISTDGYCYIESTQPMLVIQFSTGGSVDNKGDPAIAMISPISQYVKEVSFISLPSGEFPLNYISVTVPENVFNNRQIMLNGRRLDCDWEDIFNREDEVVGYGCSKEISSGSSPTQHTVIHEADNGLISVLMYGFNARQSTGYAYLAGLDLTAGNGGGPGVIDIDFDTLEFFDISTFPGVQELSRSVEDSVSDRINIPDGFLFGNFIATSAYVNENGVISFEKPWKYSYPERFPTTYFHSRQTLAVAPFWSDNDIRRDGRVRYFTYCNSGTCAESQEGRDTLALVNTYINEVLDEGEDRFSGEWMLIAHWDNVHPSPHGDNDPNIGIPREELDKVNNYQAVIVSNVLRTYVVFTYICGDIEWSALGTNRAAVVGFNAIESFYNHPLSGFPEISNSISCTRQLRRRKRQVEPPFNINMELPVNEGLRERVDRCLEAYEMDELYTFGNEIDDLKEMLDSQPCPCFLSQAQADTGRFQQQRDQTQCYVSTVPVKFRTFFATLTLTQQCCYSLGALQTSTRSGYAGTFLLHHPHFDMENYERIDRQFRQKCCGDVSFGVYCDKFFERRGQAPNNCREPMRYQPVAVAYAAGDPHFGAFFGKRYDFQGWADFVTFEVVPEPNKGENVDINSNQPVFSLQGRTNMVSNWPGNTVHQAFAFGTKELAFQFGTSPPSGFRVFQTYPLENRREITHLILNCGINVNIAGVDESKVQLCRSGNTLFASDYTSGVNFIVSYHNLYLNINVRVSEALSGRIRGVLGSLDGFLHRRETNGVVNLVSSSLNDQQLFSHLYTWLIKSGESLFWDVRRGKRQTMADFVPIYFDQLNFTDTQRMLCEDNKECLYDLVITQEPGVAMQTLNQQKESNETREILNNFPPNVTAMDIFRVNLAMESVLVLTVMDPGDKFSLNVSGGLPNNSVIEQMSSGVFAFKWTLQQVTYEPLVFVANDSKGASSLFIPIVEICACVNGGNCSREGLLTNNATLLLNCECSEAFAGRFCEEDRNGCSEIQCFEGVECMDVPAPGVGAVCGSCPPGYTGDSRKCYDIDECSLNRTLCDQVCVNMDGGYFCSCNDGFQLIDGSVQCEDINECEGVNDCQQNCENTIGSYNCSCNDGFTLDGDGRNCTADVPCDGACSFACAVIGGQEVCYCPAGFELTSPNGTQCVDLNECVNNPCQQECRNTGGSFTCLCTSGYQLSDDGLSCEDINECLEAAISLMDLCVNVTNSRCVNVEGSFTCTCAPGFEFNENGTACQVIENEPPPPPPPVIRPASSANNSINFTSPILQVNSFSPELRQRFRETTANAVTTFCSRIVCELIISKDEKQQVSNLKVDSTNVALPSSLIFEGSRGELVFTFYVQVGDGVLSREQLQFALIQAEEQFINAGFFPPRPTIPPTTMPPPTTEAPTTESTTTEEPTTEPATTQEPTTEPTMTEEVTEEPTTAVSTTEEVSTILVTTVATTMGPTTEAPVIEPNCEDEPDRGGCRGSLLRYFFNQRTGRCEVFVYGGCGGNGNNFETLEDCTQECNPNNCPPYCTVEYCSVRATRRSLCTLTEPANDRCNAKCRVTYCHVCYYDDEYRPLHQGCETCTRTEIEQQSKCFKRWTTCTRRADGALYSKLRPRHRTRDRFKCYEHPCV